MEALGPGVWGIYNGINVGVIELGNGNCALMDTGMTKQKAKQLLKELAPTGLKPIAIINTHAHADHFGGNAQVIEQGKSEGRIVRVFCPAQEDVTLNYPLLEPIGLFAGASPIPELCNSFLLGPTSPVDYLIKQDEVLPLEEIAGVATTVRVEAVSLVGHTINHFGYRVNGVFFAGDSVLAAETVMKHGLPFCFDVGNQFAALDKLENIEANRFLPCHAASCDKNGLSELIAVNRGQMERAAEALRKALKEAGNVGLDGSGAVAAIADGLEMLFSSLQSYWLAHLTTHGYLRWLYGLGEITPELWDNKLYWKWVF